MNFKKGCKLIGFYALCSFATQGAWADQVEQVYSLQKGLHVDGGAHTKYVIHLGAFRNKDNAMRYQQEMQRYTSASVQIKNGETYHVYVGPLSSGDTHMASKQLMEKHPVSHAAAPAVTTPLEALKEAVFPDSSATKEVAKPSGRYKAYRMRYKPRFYRSHQSTEKPVVYKDSKMGPVTMPSQTNERLSFLGSLGYTGYNGTYDGNGQTAVGRFATGIHVYERPEFSLSRHSSATHNLKLGLEIGVQNGKRLPIQTTQATIDDMGGLPIWTTIQPMLDFLGTVKVSSLSSPGFVIAKGGFALRRWQLERDTISNLYQVGGEFQGGFGYNTTQHTAVSLLYQGVWGGSPNLTLLNTTDGTAKVSNIPSQNGFLLTLALTV